MFSVKDSVPQRLRSRVVQINSHVLTIYVGETTHYICTCPRAVCVGGQGFACPKYFMYPFQIL